jgi:hypothetical protein
MYEVNEGDVTATITVTRVGGSDGAASVNVGTGNGTAKKNKDYKKIAETLKWSDGDSSAKIFTVLIIDDNEYEDDEIFYLKLKKAKGAELGNPKKAEVTIIDDDYEPGTLQFSYATYSVNEDGGSVDVTVTRAGGSDGAISVKCKSSDGSAIAGQDYSAVSQTLSWGNGDTDNKTCTASIIDDAVVEDDETFSLSLKNATGGATIGNPDTTEVTIVDNDSEPGTLQFFSTMYSVNENGGPEVISVTRAGGSDGAISVRCKSSDGSAIAGQDYNAISQTLNWGDGDADDKTCTASIINDTDVEGDETFSLSLKNATGGATIGDPDTTEVIIFDDDEPTKPGILQFSSDTYYVSENGGSVAITVIRVGGSDGAVSVKAVTGNGTAKKNKDYKKTTETLKWDDGDGSAKTFTVKILDDAKVEDDETFKLGLKKAKGAGLGKPKKVEVIIIDDDKSGVNCNDVTDTVCPVLSVLQFSESTYSVNENKGIVTLAITRTGSSDGEVSVDCVTSDESATAGDDYDGSFERLIWADGDSKDKECQIDILDDSNLEGSETFIVSIGHPHGAELGALNTVTVTIVDDE